MFTFKSVTQLLEQSLLVGDVVQVLGETSEGDSQVLHGRVYPRDYVTTNRVVVLANSNKVVLNPVAASDSYVYKGNISTVVGTELPYSARYNAYQYPDNSDQWYAPIQDQSFPITIPADPESSDAWVVVNALTIDGLGSISNYEFDSVADAVANKFKVSYVGGMKLRTTSYYGESAYTGKRYGGADYIVTVSDADKVAAGIQVNLVGMLAMELVDYNDVYISQIGALDSSSQDAVTKIQPYVNYFRNQKDSFRLKIELTTYFFSTTLDLSNFGNNSSITIEGVSKTRINSRGTGSIIYGNTGNNNPVINHAGSENVNLDKFSIFSAAATPTLGSPSTLGILMARTATKPYCQFINLNKIHIDLVSIPTVNNNYGSIGVYNYASETHGWSDVSIAADTPMIMTTTNIAGITYNDYFDNTGKESQNTTTNFNYDNLQLYPKTYSPLILDIVRDLEVNTYLAFGESLLEKYVVEMQGILPNRRIKIKNIHSEYIRRGFRVSAPLLESKFEGKLGASNTDIMTLVTGDGRMSQVDFECFNVTGGGAVTLIKDNTSNESFDVTVKMCKETNGPNVPVAYDLGSAIYNELRIHHDYSWQTVNDAITSVPQNQIIIHGRDGVYYRGTFYRGTTATRPVEGLFIGKVYYDTTLDGEVVWNGTFWNESNVVIKATTAELEDKTSNINTVNKTIYKKVLNTDTVATVTASGTSSTSTWRNALGAVAHTPV
ncbi:hypothetical protein VOWphi5012_007 [Vibrio phage phi50-12]|uniref:Uncharacterized protein n=1 Tax=Vibrio phage phi50-12 TaxID=2654972 RepID=A0A5P8PSN9_9CAUD|nr:hypothetical protein KNU82_gp007 [Vibrio phage phi50-12]QFR59791.1 hypothetical protein VOWphi5012_007 [Vibrio phage phi50-12]